MDIDQFLELQRAKPRARKLHAYASLIKELRSKGGTYEQICLYLAQERGVRVSVSAVQQHCTKYPCEQGMAIPTAGCLSPTHSSAGNSSARQSPSPSDLTTRPPGKLPVDAEPWGLNVEGVRRSFGSADAPARTYGPSIPAAEAMPKDVASPPSRARPIVRTWDPHAPENKAFVEAIVTGGPDAEPNTKT
jgi:hypothetical protein